MSFLIKSPSENKKTLRVILSYDVFLDMKKYCEKAGIKKKDYFIEECIKYVLSKDIYWKEISKNYPTNIN